MVIKANSVCSIIFGVLLLGISLGSAHRDTLWLPTVSREVHARRLTWAARESSLAVRSDVRRGEPREGRIAQRGLGASFMIDTVIRPIPKAGPGEGLSQVAPAATFDGTNYLVVWQDYSDSAEDPNICCTRVSPSGTILDPANGISVGPILGIQACPSVAFGNGVYLVVWGDSSGSDYDIHSARLAPSGVVLDSPGFVVSSASGNQNHPVVAFDGTNFLVVWDDTRGSSADIYASRVTPTGQVLDPSGIVLSSAGGNQTLPAVAFGGGCYVSAWLDRRSGNSDIYGSRISASGQVLDSNGIRISSAAGSQEMPAAAFDGTNFIIVWDDWRNPSSADIYVARLTPGGQVLDSSGIAVSTAATDQVEPAVAFDGSNYLAVWEDNRNPATAPQVYGARISPNGSVLEPNGIRISDSTRHPSQAAVVAGAGQFLALWQSKGVYGAWHIWGARVTPGGAVLDTSAIFISTQADKQWNPAVAFDGTNYLVVWANQIPEVGLAYGEDFTIYGRRVTQSGVPLDTLGFRIAPLPFGFLGPFFPAIAFDGANSLVVWRGDRTIEAARVSPSRAVLDSPPILVSAGPTDGSTKPAVAFDGTNYLVVWDDWRSGSRGIIYAARVTAAGQLLDTEGICLSATPSDQWMAAVAFDGTNYLVTWSDRRGSTDFDIYATLVTTSGVVLDTAGIPVSRAPNRQTEPAVAFDGTNYLVTWQDGRSSRTGVYCARVSPAGVVLDTAGIYVAPSMLGNGLSLVFDGTNYFSVRVSGGLVKGAVISTSGVVLDTMFVMDGLFPKLAVGSGGQKLVVGDCFTDIFQGKPYRTYRVWGRMSPFESITENYLQRPNQGPGISVFPNPAHSRFFVRSSQAITRLAIYDAAGRLIRIERPADKAGSNEMKIATWNMAAGIYFLELGTGTRSVRTKLVVE